VAAATELLKARGVKKLIPLKVSAPFHCSLLKPAAEKLAKDLAAIDVRDPKIPYVANVDAEVVRTKERIKQRLVDQVAKPVLWTQSLQRILLEFSPGRAVEVGPGQVVCGHMKKIDDTVPRFPTDSAEALAAVSV
jgi:[acyl-carrier-protein] S-malonyltransferase